MKSQQLPIIAVDNDVVTVIDMYSVEPVRQEALLDQLVKLIETVFKRQQGFVSASLYRSLDGVRVAHYMQWKQQQDYENALHAPELQPLRNALSAFSQPDSHLYKVVLVVFGEFRLKPENQQRLVERESQNVTIAMQQPGLLSANFHQGLDGTRMMNYAQVRSQEDVVGLASQAQFAPQSAYWQDLAQNEYHVYTLVFSEFSL